MAWETKANLRARIDSVERYNNYLQEEVRRQHGKVIMAPMSRPPTTI